MGVSVGCLNRLGREEEGIIGLDEREEVDESELESEADSESSSESEFSITSWDRPADSFATRVSRAGRSRFSMTPGRAKKKKERGT